MMKILVPVDFHDTSFSALRYATFLAERIGGHITLLHVINGSFNTNEVVQFDPLLRLEDAALKRLKYFSEEYPDVIGKKLGNASMGHEVRFGIPGFRTASYANENDFDLIIMGTRDKHGLFDRLLGSASSITIRQADCPVILIHKDTPYKDPKKIAFAFDAKGDLDDAIDDFKEINNILRVATDFVHVKRKDEVSLLSQKEEILDELFNDNDPQFSFDIKEIEGKKVRMSLMEYCVENDVNILALMHRSEGVLSSIFGSDSIKIAQEFLLPVMVFQE